MPMSPRHFSYQSLFACPLKSPFVTFIIVRSDGRPPAFAKETFDKIQLLNEAQPSDTILVAWPGRNSQDIFILDTPEILQAVRATF